MHLPLSIFACTSEQAAIYIINQTQFILDLTHHSVHHIPFEASFSELALVVVWDTTTRGGGGVGGILPYMGSTSGLKGYGFSAVLVINRVSN